MNYIIALPFYTIPLAAIVFFIISLVKFISARVKNRRNEGSVSQTTLTVTKVLLIISSVVVGVLLTALVFIIAVVYSAIAYM